MCDHRPQGYNGEINTGEMREGAVDVNMKIRREVVNTEVITPPKADNTMAHAPYM
jgi:hypothetical protein